MRKELKVAAKNTMWMHFGLRALYFGDEYGIENSMEKAIFRESIWLGYHVSNAVIEGLHKDCDLSLLNLHHDYILREYSKKYPELCLILCFLTPLGTISPSGYTGDLLTAANRAFGTSPRSPLRNVDFYAKNIPVIRITDNVFTLGTNQPRFSTIADVKNYYRDKARIAEIVALCEFWIRKFWEE